MPGDDTLKAALLRSLRMSWGPVVWVLLGEMFNNRIRAIALSVAATARWLANWAVSVSFPYLKEVGLGLAYALYTTAALLSFVFVMKWVKETCRMPKYGLVL